MTARPIITPLKPYFGVVVAFVQQYDRKAGIGTIIATMLSYRISFIIAWTVLLIIWMQFNWPLGPGAGIFMP